MKLLISLDNNKLYNISLNTKTDDSSQDEFSKPLIIKDTVLKDVKNKIIHMEKINNKIALVLGNGSVMFYDYSFKSTNNNPDFIEYNMISLDNLVQTVNINFNDDIIVSSNKVNRKSKQPIQFNTSNISNNDIETDQVLTSSIRIINNLLFIPIRSGLMTFINIDDYTVFNHQLSAPLSFIKIIESDKEKIKLTAGGYENLLKVYEFNLNNKELSTIMSSKPMKFNEHLNLAFPNWPVYSTNIIDQTSKEEYFLEFTKFGHLKYYNFKNSKKPINGLKDVLLSRPFQKNLQPILMNILELDSSNEDSKTFILTDNFKSIWEVNVTISNNEITIKQNGKVSKNISGYVGYVNEKTEPSDIPQIFTIPAKDEDQEDHIEEVKPLDKEETQYLLNKSNFVKNSTLLTYTTSSKLNIMKIENNIKKHIIDWTADSKILSVLVYDYSDVLDKKKYQKYINRLIRKRGVSVEEEENEKMWDQLEANPPKRQKK
ncbi:uncharacterized protein HGUI_03662 [Hanseniaspora guilliermondii]|uniref:Ribosome biogenesis protein NSA1 n=1 Tax=Hanseniaspora guilliermondii TaxID=56406 RepID=A0A1L0CR08_9ASCO|nr:uncharacterized protein HGUI_03662 [Hanseniaspora guilliermondii]